MTKSAAPSAGVLIVDKPPGPTSHDVVDRVRKVLGMRRVGHAGTLDPAASGVLVVAFGPATRLLPYAASDDKEYAAVVRLGVRTDTFDLEGEVLERRDASGIGELDVRTALAPLEGEILQLPPMYSAVKVDGEPLYRRARRGEDVLRAPRRVCVHRLDLVRFDPPEVHLEIACGKGTYIRALAESLGEALGCGAVLASLRRTRSGRFGIDRAVPLEKIAPGHAGSPDDLLAHLAAIRLGEDETRRFVHGNAQPVGGADPGALVRVHGPDGTFLGVGQVEGGRLRPKKVLFPVSGRPVKET